MADQASLVPVAQALAKQPHHANPIHQPHVHAALRNSHPELAKHIDQIKSDPALRAIASGSGPSGGSGASAGSSAAQDSIAPNQTLYKRLPQVRHQLLGMAALVFLGAGTSVGKYTPQMRFKGNRLVIPSNTLAGTTISNVLVGTRPQYASAGSSEPFDMFEEQSTGGIWDLDVCDIGQFISISYTVTGATTVYSCIIGEMLDGKAYSSIRSPLKRAGWGTGTATVASGASTNITITPQVRYKIRKLIADDTTAKYFAITQLTVGITPQFVSPDPVPLAAFTEIAQDVWVDWDEAYIGNVVTLTLLNIDNNARAINGSTLGDVDPRDLALASA